MTSSHLLISDYLSSEIGGGAEANDSVIRYEFGCPAIRSREFNASFRIYSGKTFIVSNFWELSEESKNFLLGQEYYIVEHDYKMFASRVPDSFDKINLEFYKAARFVIFQSPLQLSIIGDSFVKSINCHVFGANLWLDSELDFFANFNYTPLINAAAILHGSGIKDNSSSIKYCTDAGINYSIIPRMSRDCFINELSKYHMFCNIPKYPETYSRVSAEAKMLGLECILGNNVGISSCESFNLNRLDFIQYQRDKKQWLKNLLSQ